MNLLTNGIGVQHATWGVKQENAAGFSRVYYIMSGNVIYRDNYTEKQLRHGCMYVFPASRAYSISHTAENPIECMWFHIDFFPYDVDRMIEFDLTEYETLGYIIQALLCEKRRELQLMLTEAMCRVLTYHYDMKKIGAGVREILGYIRVHFSESDLSVNSIAEHFAYSVEHLIRTFRAECNTTPYKYLGAIRMSYAAECLLKGDSVTVTAEKCGYGEVKTFSKAFRRMYGVSPSRYTEFYRAQA